ncbi:MAG: carboxyltransferase domain-containing protein [Gordonia sp. (in: high G+C Gram-positive bacteria)]|uniref:5-oxoprolinase subunit B family protein n=1 Tax=Gordonia sp. (in: high G+C Gram-positive bacteria) TaxID=84139 RepID=UPI0039E59362
MRERPAGQAAVLLDFTATPAPRAATMAAIAALRRASESGGLPGIVDLVPTATTILVQGTPETGIDDLALHRALRGGGQSTDDDDADEVVIPVHYDGPDLHDVALHLGWTPGAVVASHTGIAWRVEFMGFAPGFGYLVPDDPEDRCPPCELPRRDESRPRVDAGSVAVAAGYSAVYPGASPGGWNLLGHTDFPLWDAAADPPTPLRAGTIVRFVDAGEPR